MLPGKGRTIPTDELTLAADLYAALQAFFERYPEMQPRPLVVAGESYAGRAGGGGGGWGGAGGGTRLLHLTPAAQR